MWHVWRRRKMCTRLWLGNQKGGTSGKSRHRWKYNITVDIEETGLMDVCCFNLAEDRHEWHLP
jgi:hypothetical protein